MLPLLLPNWLDEMLVKLVSIGNDNTRNSVPYKEWNYWVKRYKATLSCSYKLYWIWILYLSIVADGGAIYSLFCTLYIYFMYAHCRSVQHILFIKYVKLVIPWCLIECWATKKHTETTLTKWTETAN